MEEGGRERFVVREAYIDTYIYISIACRSVSDSDALHIYSYLSLLFFSTRVDLYNRHRFTIIALLSFSSF